MTEQFTGTLPPILPILKTFSTLSSPTQRIALTLRSNLDLTSKIHFLTSSRLSICRSHDHKTFAQNHRVQTAFNKLWNHFATLPTCSFDLLGYSRLNRGGWTLSQERRAGTRNTGPIVNSSETLSFDPSSPVSNRVVRLWSSARSQFRRIPIAPYNELLGRAHPAFPPLLSLPTGPQLLLGVLRVRRIVSSRGVIPNLNKLHFIARCVAICRLLDGRFLMI